MKPESDDKKRMSNARFALLIAIIPVVLFVLAFFTKM
jgi:hypothetical protein